jgi:hypothetical protein
MADGKALQAEINNLQKQLKMSKNEADKLRDQLSNRYSVAIILRVWKHFVPLRLMFMVITNVNLLLLTQPINQ